MTKDEAIAGLNLLISKIQQVLEGRGELTEEEKQLINDLYLWYDGYKTRNRRGE